MVAEDHKAARRSALLKEHGMGLACVDRGLVMDYKLAGKRIWVAGRRGMVGRSVVRRLELEDCEIIKAGREELDLLDPNCSETLDGSISSRLCSNCSCKGWEAFMPTTLRRLIF